VPSPQRGPRRRRYRALRWSGRTLLLLLILGLALSAVQLVRTYPSVAPIVTADASTQLGAPPALPWPAGGEATIRVEGLGSLGSSGPLQPIPMASTAKVMVALLILEDHPIGLDQPGPSITISAADVADYQRDVALDESSVPLVVGEQLSEYQLLQGLLIPSASNFADLLARWDAGSLEAFVARMNQRAMALGMAHTRYADASGFSPASVSVPADLVTLARQAMHDPIFARIVAQPAVTLPIAGTRTSTDALLSEGVVIGVKTGHTDQAGGNFVFAAQSGVQGFPVEIFGAVMGQSSLPAAFDATRTLLHGVIAHLHYAIVVHRLQPVALYRAPWGAQTGAQPDDFLQFLYADGMTLRRQIVVGPVQPPIMAGTVLGTLTVQIGDQRQTVPLVSDGALAEPSIRWRLTRPPG
jgi:serine-type D-Ala-D-Ala carboxypeptidase (penicillin-binding protein 5/6)